MMVTYKERACYEQHGVKGQNDPYFATVISLVFVVQCKETNPGFETARVSLSSDDKTTKQNKQTHTSETKMTLPSYQMLC